MYNITLQFCPLIYIAELANHIVDLYTKSNLKTLHPVVDSVKIHPWKEGKSD